jgi:hypothetical protein
LSVSSANLRALMIWPSRPLSDGRYRVVMDAGASPNFIDTAGRSLGAGAADELAEPVIATFEVEVHP